MEADLSPESDAVSGPGMTGSVGSPMTSANTDEYAMLQCVLGSVVSDGISTAGGGAPFAGAFPPAGAGVGASGTICMAIFGRLFNIITCLRGMHFMNEYANAKNMRCIE